MENHAVQKEIVKSALVIRDIQGMRAAITNNTHAGLVREDNQDAFGWFSVGNHELFIVADGMGGEAGGKEAAKMAVDTIREYFERGGPSVQAILKSAIEEANSRIHAKGTSGDPRYKKMGTTVVVLFIKDGKAYIAHDGDSRLYLYRHGRLERMTKDHSRVQEMVDGGLIKAEDADDHPDANIITRSLGSKPTIEVDICMPQKIMPGDVFLLCTDGLCGLVKDHEIQEILSKKLPVNETCDMLIEMALARGGHDNVTVQLVAFEGKPPKDTLNEHPIRFEDRNGNQQEPDEKTKPEPQGRFQNSIKREDDWRTESQLYKGPLKINDHSGGYKKQFNKIKNLKFGVLIVLVLIILVLSAVLVKRTFFNGDSKTPVTTTPQIQQVTTTVQHTTTTLVTSTTTLTTPPTTFSQPAAIEETKGNITEEDIKNDSGGSKENVKIEDSSIIDFEKYTIQDGDTLKKIANRYQTTISGLIEINNKSLKDKKQDEDLKKAGIKEILVPIIKPKSHQ